MLISSAFAQTPAAGPQGGGDLITSLLPFMLIFIIIYFLMIRPQQKKMKEHQEMVKNLRRGDRIVTTGGLLGTITKVVDDHELEVEIASNVKARILRGTVAEVRTKGEPIKDEA